MTTFTTLEVKTTAADSPAIKQIGIVAFADSKPAIQYTVQVKREGPEGASRFEDIAQHASNLLSEALVVTYGPGSRETLPGSRHGSAESKMARLPGDR